MKHLYLVLILLVSSKLHAQIYFPPTTGSTWDTISPQSIGWCQNNIDSLYDFLDSTHTKGFIVLKNGKIILEKYFGTFTKDSAWYWASAGKSMVGFLTGVAQENGLLNINQKASDFLGNGWTSETQIQEDSITIKHQLSMTTGLDDAVADPDCAIDTCLIYKASAGSRWAYHNAPYHLIQDVLSIASGTPSFQNYMNTTLLSKTGISGLVIDHTIWSQPRKMARFGLLCLNHGIWNTDTILHDQNYFNAMVNSSQNINPSYGYLWWLNGKSKYMVPGLQFAFNGSLIPTAPNDMYAAMGKNDQRIYIVPSDSFVVVRVGENAFGSSFALSPFDSTLWKKINALNCTPNSVSTFNKNIFEIYPNPAKTFINIKTNEVNYEVTLYDMMGSIVLHQNKTSIKTLHIENIKQGIYTLEIKKDGKSFYKKIWIN